MKFQQTLTGAIGSLCLALSLLLPACQSNTAPAGSYTPKSMPNTAVNTAVGAGLGGAAGVAVGSAVGSHALMGGLIGAGLGAGIGAWTSQQEKQAMYNRLEAENIRVIELGDIVEIVLPSDKLFYANESNLTYAALPLLSDTLTFINGYGPVKINVSAHGDTTGTELHALSLTKLQAQAVMTYFWAHGKALDQMDFYGMNHQEPIGDQDSNSGEYFNRRIEIMFWKNQA